MNIQRVGAYKPPVFTQIQTHYVKELLALLVEQGVGEQQIAAQLQLSPERIIAAATGEGIDSDILRRVIALSGDAQLGLRLGARTNLLSMGVYGLALMNCATLQDALKLLLRYHGSILPKLTMTLIAREGGAELVIDSDAYTRAEKCFFCELMFAAVLTHGELLSNQQMGGVLVEFDYLPATNLHLYEQNLGSHVRFNAERSVLFMSSERLAAPISTANPIAGEFFLRECDRLFAPDSGQGRLSEKVQQLLLQSSSSFPTAAEMAKQLHMSERTLQRRLGLEGARYQPLLDEVRYRLAREYLLGTELPVVAVAELLGFSDAANFRRSFKRWSQLTPAQLRDGASAGGG